MGEAFKKKHTFSTFSHEHNTRNYANYYVPHFQRLTVSQHSLNYLLPAKFNSLPNSIKQIENFKEFKHILKDFYLANYLP